MQSSIDVRYAEWRIRSDLLDRKLALFIKDTKMPTPAETLKSVENAKLLKALMDRTAKDNEMSDQLIKSYTGTLMAYEAHLSALSKNDAALQAEMAGLGNAAVAMEAAFQDDKNDGKANGQDKGVETRPEESAHLATVTPGEPHVA
jgi:hypothetical protein